MDIQVVQASPQHTEVIAEFNQAMAIETEGKKLPWDKIHPGINAILRDSSLGFYLVALDQGEVVGCLAITYEWSDWRNGRLWWIQSVYVLPQWRSQGVFRALYQHVNELAQQTPDTRGIRLYVEKDNHTAQAVYQNLGMSQTAYRVFETTF